MKISLGVGEGIGLDRCEFEGVCMCECVGFLCVSATSVSMLVIQMCLRRGRVMPTYFPGDSNQTCPETHKQTYKLHGKEADSTSGRFCNAIFCGRLTKY